MSTQGREVWLGTLRGLLGEAFALQQKGALGARIGRAYGAVDGYTRALVELGVASRSELTRIVAEERTQRLGPATTPVAADPVERDTLAA